MKIRRDIFSFRNRVVVIIVGVSLGMVSLLYTNNMAKRLKEKESTTWRCGPMRWSVRTAT